MRSIFAVLGFPVTVFWVALTIAGECRGAASVEIFVPGEHVSSLRNRVSVVGISTVPLLRLYLNGEFQYQLTAYDSVFHTTVQIPYGLNEIRVTVAPGDSTDSEAVGDSVQVLCGPRFSQAQGRFFPEYRFHNEEPPEACLRCHVQDRQDRVGVTTAKWCYPCHNTVRQRLQEHIVDEVRPCIGCHRIERDLTSTTDTDATPVEKNPCFKCHEDKIGAFAKDYIHGPVAGGSCITCHDPHGSEFDKTLVRPVPVLCETCHADVSGTTSRVQHYPFAQGWCTDCHDAHATSNKWVLLKEGQELCLGCHFNDGTERTHEHPYGVKPKRKLLVSLPLASDGTLECLSCHEAHAADASRLLRTNSVNICLGCHPDIE